MYMQDDMGKACLSEGRLQLTNTLRRLWMEHVMWTRSFIISTAFNLPDLNDTTNRLLRNPKDFAEALRPLYGSDKADKFDKLLTAHLLIAAALVKAAKAGDTRAADEQRKLWYANADDIASFLSSINLYFSKAAWKAMLYDHLKMTENEAVQLLTGQYAASIEQYDAIENEALKMADEMARGIVMQFGL